MHCPHCAQELLRDHLCEVRFNNNHADYLHLSFECQRCGEKAVRVIKEEDAPEWLRKGVERKRNDPITSDEALDFSLGLRNNFAMPKA